MNALRWLLLAVLLSPTWLHAQTIIAHNLLSLQAQKPSPLPASRVAPVLSVQLKTNSPTTAPPPAKSPSPLITRPKRDTGHSAQEPTILKPGIYESVPYTCIVVVPPAHADDRCIIGKPGSDQPTMPIIKPDLQFLPRGQK